MLMMPFWDEGTWDSGFWDAPAPPQPTTPTLPLRRRHLNRRTMASNPTPENSDVLRALADRMADGCASHEATIGILQNTEATMRAAIAALSAAETDLGLKKSAVGAAYALLQTADTTGQTTLTNCKLCLAAKLGQRWSAAWEPTGFPNQSTSIPSTQDKRFTLLDALKNYFTLLPAHENAGMGATAALCGAAWTALSNARQAVADAEAAQTAAFNTRAAVTDALRKRVRGLIQELGTLIAEDDPRWEAFGLNIPANPSAPEPVASIVTAAALGGGRVELRWTYATRATRYRVESFAVGVDTEWQSRGNARDLEIILKSLTPGQTQKLRVVAANDGGEASPSPEAEVVVL